MTPEIEADDLAIIIDTVGGGRADVFGSSGGAIAGWPLPLAIPTRPALLSPTSRRAAARRPARAHRGRRIDDASGVGSVRRGGSSSPSSCTTDR